jgi:protein-tyrosine phosphatase
VLACYLVKYYGMTAHRAVSQIRIHRPGSIETSEQEKTVYLYEQNICSAASLLQD